MKKFFVMIVLAVAVLLGLVTPQAHAEVKNVSAHKSITVTWQGESGKFYQVVKTFSLPVTNWIAVDSNILGETNMMSRSYPILNDNEFFDVVEMTDNISLTNTLIYSKTLTNQNLSKIPFTHSDVILTDFTRSSLLGCEFSDTIINFAYFDQTDMRSTTFHGCPYIYASFYAANLSDSDFNGSYVYLGDFRNVTFDPAVTSFFGAFLYGCDFTGAVGLNVYGAHFSMCTMPDGSMRNDP